MAAITPALITALHTGFRREFQAGQAKAAPIWDRVATAVPSTDAKNTYGWLGQFPQMREWIGDRVVKDMKAHAYEIENKAYEATVGIDRDAIEDDRFGTYGPMFQEMGYAAATQIDLALWPMIKAGDSALAYDGQFFFDTDHPVAANHDGTGAVTSVSNLTAGVGPAWFVLATDRPLKPFIVQQRRAADLITKFNPRDSDQVFMSKQFLWGVDMRFATGFGLWQFAHMSKAALTSDSLFTVIEAMMSVKADGGRPLGVTPNLLVVPPALEAEATKTVKVMMTDGGASNPTYQRLDVLTTPWLA